MSHLTKKELTFYFSGSPLIYQFNEKQFRQIGVGKSKKGAIRYNKVF